ncbi:ATP-dependent RNA helicase DDX47/RRP3 [Enteropsectra breve]|nr:ATP-dependent RNA helicase DDX47/RRP3 [Enteropsectra breve]
MKFEEIKIEPEVVALLRKNELERMTEIQEKTIKMAIAGQDVIGVSKTGTGKTLSFIIPLVSQILKTKKTFYGMILAPTRELAQQIAEVVKMFESLEIRHALLVGGEPLTPQVNMINSKPHIIIGTPGRIIKHIEKTKNFRIEKIRKIVFDEADRFFENDFITELEVLYKKLKCKNQVLMYTATITEKVERLAKLFMRDPKIVDVTSGNSALELLDEKIVFVPEQNKAPVLLSILKESAGVKAIVFVGMCTMTEKISEFLKAYGVAVFALNGNMSQPTRESTLAEYRNSADGILVSTDLAGRGLDIPEVDMVINYDLPQTSKNYTHRIGRTARAGKHGRAVNIISQYDIVQLQKIEYALKRSISMSETLVTVDQQCIETFKNIGKKLNSKNN